MDAKPRAVAHRVYEDFEPQREWAIEEGFDTLIVLLPGFRKEHLKVQITSSRNLRISGERLLGNNKWRRFHNEFSIPPNVDANGIVAKFEGSTLYVKHPKVISLAEPQEQAKTHAEVSKPQQKPKSEPQAQKSAQEQSTREVPSKFSLDKGTNEKTIAQPNAYNAAQKTSKNEKEANDITGKSTANKVPQKVPEKEKEPNNSDGKISTVADANKASRKTLEKEKEPNDANKKKSTSAEANNISQKSSEKEGSSWLEKAEKVTSTRSDQKNETLGDSIKNVTKMDKGAIASGKSRLEDYKQVVGGLVMELKNPNKLMTLVVVALFVVVLVLYVKNATKPFGGSKSHFL